MGMSPPCRDRACRQAETPKLHLSSYAPVQFSEASSLLAARSKAQRAVRQVGDADHNRSMREQHFQSVHQIRGPSRNVLPSGRSIFATPRLPVAL
jgi:hypothetical protein